MAYTSPISVGVDTVTVSLEDGVIRTLTNYGFDVDKEALRAALAYDRNQYISGYEDGRKEATGMAASWTPQGTCTHCGQSGIRGDAGNIVTSPFCPNCGFQMLPLEG